MKTITFQLTAMQPLLLTSLQGDPNSSVSFPYIPGSVIRGALIGQYCQGKDLNLEDAQVQRWFFDGTTRYLHAYPLIQGRRAVPIPRTLAAEKTAEWDQGKLKVYDRSVATQHQIPLRALAGFLARDQRGHLWHTSSHMLLNIHNQRDRPRGRGVEGAGAVFRYEAIAPEQIFEAAIICDDNDAVLIKGLIPGRMWLGGSRSAGYGEVRIDLDAVTIVDDWREMQPLPAVEPSDDEELSDDEEDAPLSKNDPTRLTITLTSDMILRADNGGYTAEPPHRQIAALLGVNLKFDETRTTLGTTLHGGFNRTWGLPVPQIPALAAGSVLTYTCDTQPAAADIARLEAEGLGQRRAEGFGHVVCNLLPFSETLTIYRWPPEEQLTDSDADVQAEVLDDESRKLAEVMARRILEQRLETRLIEQTQIHRISNTISNTQLSRMRIIARRALGTGNLQVIKKFLDQLPANAREQFARARVGHQSLETWIREHLTPVPTEWDNERLKVSVADVTLEPDRKMKSDFTLRLLMAMARLKVKGGEHE